MSLWIFLKIIDGINLDGPTDKPSSKKLTCRINTADTVTKLFSTSTSAVTSNPVFLHPHIFQANYNKTEKWHLQLEVKVTKQYSKSTTSLAVLKISNGAILNANNKHLLIPANDTGGMIRLYIHVIRYNFHLPSTIMNHISLPPLRILMERSEYYRGQTIRGVIIYDLKKPKVLKGITLSIVGTRASDFSSSSSNLEIQINRTAIFQPLEYKDKITALRRSQSPRALARSPSPSSSPGMPRKSSMSSIEGPPVLDGDNISGSLRKSGSGSFWKRLRSPRGSLSNLFGSGSGSSTGSSPAASPSSSMTQLPSLTQLQQEAVLLSTSEPNSAHSSTLLDPESPHPLKEEHTPIDPNDLDWQLSQLSSEQKSGTVNIPQLETLTPPGTYVFPFEYTIPLDSPVDLIPGRGNFLVKVKAGDDSQQAIFHVVKSSMEDKVLQWLNAIKSKLNTKILEPYDKKLWLSDLIPPSINECHTSAWLISSEMSEPLGDDSSLTDSAFSPRLSPFEIMNPTPVAPFAEDEEYEDLETSIAFPPPVVTETPQSARGASPRRPRLHSQASLPAFNLSTARLSWKAPSKNQGQMANYTTAAAGFPRIVTTGPDLLFPGTAYELEVIIKNTLDSFIPSITGNMMFHIVMSPLGGTQMGSYNVQDDWILYENQMCSATTDINLKPGDTCTLRMSFSLPFRSLCSGPRRAAFWNAPQVVWKAYNNIANASAELCLVHGIVFTIPVQVGSESIPCRVHRHPVSVRNPKSAAASNTCGTNQIRIGIIDDNTINDVDAMVQLQIPKREPFVSPFVPMRRLVLKSSKFGGDVASFQDQLPEYYQECTPLPQKWFAVSNLLAPPQFSNKPKQEGHIDWILPKASRRSSMSSPQGSAPNSPVSSPPLGFGTPVGSLKIGLETGDSVVLTESPTPSPRTPHIKMFQAPSSSSSNTMPSPIFTRSEYESLKDLPSGNGVPSPRRTDWIPSKQSTQDSFNMASSSDESGSDPVNPSIPASISVAPPSTTAAIPIPEPTPIRTELFPASPPTYRFLDIISLAPPDENDDIAEPHNPFIQ